MNDFLHVANGTSTTMTIEAARIPGAVSIWADPLHDGPVPGHLIDDALLELRARHLADPDVVSAVRRSITDAGLAVLAGTADRVALCGIDRWFGGVHLHAGNLWRWDDESQRIGAA